MAFEIVAKNIEVPYWKILTAREVNKVRSADTSLGSSKNIQLRQQMSMSTTGGNFAGWDYRYPATLLSPDCWPIADVETSIPVPKKRVYDKAVQERKDLYNTLQTDAEKRKLLEAFRYLYCDEHGQLLIPTIEEAYFAASGNQRLNVIVIPACADALAAGLTFDKYVPSGVIRVHSMNDLLSEQLQANKFGSAQNEMSRLGMAQAAMFKIRAGVTETDFRKDLGAQGPSGDADKDSADKTVGRFVYKLAQVCVFAHNKKVPFFEHLVESIKEPKDNEIKVESFRTTGGSKFDLSVVVRCCTNFDDSKNGLIAYASKYKKVDLVSNPNTPDIAKLDPLEQETWHRGQPWGQQELSDWVRSVKWANAREGGDAPPRNKNVQVNDVAGLVENAGSVVLKDYVVGLVKNENMPGREAMAAIAPYIDMLPKLAQIPGALSFFEELVHFSEVADVNYSAAVVAKCVDALKHAVETVPTEPSATAEQEPTVPTESAVTETSVTETGTLEEVIEETDAAEAAALEEAEAAAPEPETSGKGKKGRKGH